MTSQDLEHYADKAMYEAAPMEKGEGELIEPSVRMLWMTPDPLGANAAACRMYEGKPTYDLAEVTDEERRHYLAQVQATHLRAPLEFIKLHFFIEGVDRGFTHQIVRQRTAVYAQESLRFAVKHNMASESVVPPSVFHGSVDVQQVFTETLEKIEEAYNWLVANGVPAEDARSILPHCVSTRMHFCTDLRNLIDHSGNRLCTQAQFHWRKVFLGIVKSIAEYTPDFSFVSDHVGEMTKVEVEQAWEEAHRWQFDELARGSLFRPVCYHMNRCPFQATFDRGCTIRDRVQTFASVGIPSDKWHEGVSIGGGTDIISPIRSEEWMMDERAAWVR